MSCGNPHETDCSEVLGHLYEYLDRELSDELIQRSIDAIASHAMNRAPKNVA